MSKILLVCTILASDGRRINKNSESLQSEQDGQASGPKRINPPLLAPKPHFSDAFWREGNLQVSDATPKFPGVLGVEGYLHTTARGAAYLEPWASDQTGTLATITKGDFRYPFLDDANNAGVAVDKVPLAKEVMAPAKFVPPAGAGPGSPMVAPEVLSAGGPDFLQAANTFFYTAHGFYSPPREDAFADDFVFRGPGVGPLNKRDYLDTLETFGIWKASPDILPFAFGFAVDPEQPRSVLFQVQNPDTNNGHQGFSFGLSLPSSGNAVFGMLESWSVTFDEAGMVKLLTVGYVVDRFAGPAGLGPAGLGQALANPQEGMASVP